MTERPGNLQDSYAQLPYESNPHPDSHPDRLATIAYLSGFESPPPVQSCRVLELGCASGGNLIPAAEAMPGATFVGIDLAPNQIADGKAIIDTLGLRNVRLEAMSVTDIPPDFGEFDYIIAHGLYSWVPPEVQQSILQTCKRHLASRGVAYISYNTYPGWRLRGTMRDLILYRLEDLPAEISLRERLDLARAFVYTIAEAAGAHDMEYPRLMRNEAKNVLRMPDSYVAHEYLESWHEPLYFRQFAARIAEHGLAYLGDARGNKTAFLAASHLKNQWPDLPSNDRVRFEQCIDFASGRQFRRSLVVHAESGGNFGLRADRLMDCYLTAGAFPPAGVPVDLSPGAPIVFNTADKGIHTITDPEVKVALLALAEAFPLPLQFNEIWSRTRAALNVPSNDPARDELSRILLLLLGSNSLEARLTPPAFIKQITPRPIASPLARWQAANGQLVHSRRHRVVRNLTDADRSLLPRLDGSYDSTSADPSARESLQRLAHHALIIG